MRTATVLLLLPPICLSTCRSQSPFDGTWVIDTSNDENLANEKLKVFLVADGMFRSADPVLKADGKDYRVPATGDWDTVSVES